MEGISVDGVVEVGHSLIVDAGDIGHPLLVRKALDVALRAMFGSIPNTVVWNIRDGVWMMWNVDMLDRFGVNETAQDVAEKAMRGRVGDEELDEAIDHIGGFVAIISEQEASLILREFTYINGPLQRMFFLQGPEDKGGGISIEAVL